MIVRGGGGCRGAGEGSEGKVATIEGAIQSRALASP